MTRSYADTESMDGSASSSTTANSLTVAAGPGGRMPLAEAEGKRKELERRRLAAGLGPAEITVPQRGSINANARLGKVGLFGKFQ